MQFLEKKLSLKISDKMKLYLPETPQNCYTHWNFQGQKPRPMEIPYDFFFTPGLEIPLLFYLPLEFPHSIYLIPFEIPCPQPPLPPVWIFFGMEWTN